MSSPRIYSCIYNYVLPPPPPPIYLCICNYVLSSPSLPPYVCVCVCVCVYVHAGDRAHARVCVCVHTNHIRWQNFLCRVIRAMDTSQMWWCDFTQMHFFIFRQCTNSNRHHRCEWVDCQFFFINISQVRIYTISRVCPVVHPSCMARALLCWTLRAFQASVTLHHEMKQSAKPTFAVVRNLL